jgi:hypothetical protein
MTNRMQFLTGNDEALSSAAAATRSLEAFFLRSRDSIEITRLAPNLGRILRLPGSICEQNPTASSVRLRQRPVALRPTGKAEL